MKPDSKAITQQMLPNIAARTAKLRDQWEQSPSVNQSVITG
jgi:hypothetical protein